MTRLSPSSVAILLALWCSAAAGSEGLSAAIEIRRGIPAELSSAQRDALELLLTRDSKNWKAGIESLRSLGEDAGPALRYLITFLDGADVLTLNMKHVVPETPEVVSWRILSVLKEQAEPFVLESLGSPSAKVRANTAGWLGAAGSHNAVEALAALSADPDVHVRMRAATALGAIGDRGGQKGLFRMLVDDEAIVREAAATASGRLGSVLGGMIERLVQLLSDESWNVQYAAVRALGELGAEEAVDPLLEIIEGQPQNIEFVVLRSLGKIGSYRATPGLIAVLPGEGGCREKVAESLGMIGDPLATEPLIDCLSSDSERARTNSLKALGAIGDRRAVPALVRVLEGNAEWERVEAAAALGAVFDERAVMPLIGALGDESMNVACSAAAALGRQNDPRAIDPLIELLYREGSDTGRCKYMWKALEAIRHEAVIPRLIETLRPGPVHARLTVLRTLNRLTGQNWPAAHDEHAIERWETWLEERRRALEPAAPGD